ncbi:IS701 family transposase [Streptomyces sp. NPDC015032]|uniref:IS701 family transposase n=1 Tax=Streptomyces sp. NPDC015032 TaxID=3364937 RepID=UPI0036FAF230
MQVELLDVVATVSDREWAEEWAGRLDDLLLEVGRFFPRVDARRRAVACVRGLLGPVSRKNGWQLAEYAGDGAPWNQQHLLDRARWDVEGMRDFTRRHVVAALADDGDGAGPGGAGVLVVDETGFAKRGIASAGVARQYSGALGGVFPCQVGVMAAWATGAGQALIDRELYLPKEWTGDPARCRAAHVPEDRAFMTKPRLAEAMIERALPDLPQGDGAVWVAADEVYGREKAFRSFLEDHHLPYVVTVQANTPVLARPGWRHAGRLVERVAREEDWVELPAGPSQLVHPRLAVVGTPDHRPGRAGRRRGLGAMDHRAPPPRGASQARLLPGLGTARDSVGRPCAGPGSALAGGGGDQAGEIRLRAGRLRGPLLPRLVPAHHPRPARRGLPGRL